MSLRAAVLALLCAGCAPRHYSNDTRVRIVDRRFVIGRDQPFVPWGFNYEWVMERGRELRVEDLVKSDRDRLERDLQAMHALRANTIRIFVPLGEVLESPDVINPAGIARAQRICRLAWKHGLRVIVTGLADIRVRDEPAWMKDIDDATMERAEATYWRALAGRLSVEPGVLAYDLQNEPAIHFRDSKSWVEGCFDEAGGERYCYVHQHERQIRARWTRFVHERFKDETSLSSAWSDYPRPGESWNSIAIPNESADDPRFREYLGLHMRLLSEWAARLAAVVRAADPKALVTIGALDPRVMAAAVDFYSLHLYPENQETMGANRQRWQAVVAGLPKDKPVIIEEFFPLRAPDQVSASEMIRALMESTRGASGWLGFYYGPAGSLAGRKAAPEALEKEWLSGYQSLLDYWRANPAQ